MSLLQHLQSVKDPRIARARRHDFQSILFIALSATLAGADNWVEVAQFAQLHKDWFARFVPSPSDIPSHDTFARECFGCSMPCNWSKAASNGSCRWPGRCRAR